MADGPQLTPSEKIRSEKPTYSDTLLGLDFLINQSISNAWGLDPAKNIEGLLSLTGLAYRKHSLISVRASHAYPIEVEENDWENKFGPGTWNVPEDDKFENFKDLMKWDYRMTREYGRLGILEPMEHIDWMGTFDQTYESIWFLLKQLPFEKLNFVHKLVDRAIKEKHCIEDSIPEETSIWGDSKDAKKLSERLG